MSDDVYEPYEKLIRIVILGRVFSVPEKNLLLRQMQYVAPDIGMGKYCWNAECRYCEVVYCRESTGTMTAALACRIKGTEDMQIVKAAPEIRHNMAGALATAKRAKE